MSLVDCCRLCLKNLADLQLDDDGHFTVADNRDLQRMILDCFQILVTDNEIISKVCSKCNGKIRAMDNIRKRVKRVDFKIQQYYASLVVQEEDNLTEELRDGSQTQTADVTGQHLTDHKQLNRQREVPVHEEIDDTIPDDNFVNECEFIEVEPLLYDDHDSTESDSSDSHSESGPSNNAPAKKRERSKSNNNKSTNVGRKVDSKCYICDTDFDTTDALDDHITSHIGSTGQTCRLCQHPISTVRYYNMHLRLVHFRKGKRIPCNECKNNNVVREFSSKSMLNAHIRREHDKVVEVKEKKFMCTYCGKSFNRAANCRLHENIHTKAVVFKCKQCPFTATSKTGLVRHGRTHTAEKPFKCDECDACFNQSTSLNTHKTAKHRKVAAVVRQPQVTVLGTEIAISKRELRCYFCPAIYSWEKFLCQHIVEKHPLEDVPMLSCEQCLCVDKHVFFLTQTEKDRHIANHKKPTTVQIKDRVCPDCGEVYQTAETYQKHRQTHINHICKDCGKTFASRKTLRLHVITVHLKLRPYKCDKCNASFGQFTTLTLHMKTHQNTGNTSGRRQRNI